MTPRAKVKAKIIEILSERKEKLKYNVLDSNRSKQIEDTELPAVVVYIQNDRPNTVLARSPELKVERELNVLIKCIYKGKPDELEAFTWMIENVLLAKDVIPFKDEQVFEILNINDVDFEYNSEGDDEIGFGNINCGVLYVPKIKYDQLLDFSGITTKVKSSQIEGKFTIE